MRYDKSTIAKQSHRIRRDKGNTGLDGEMTWLKRYIMYAQDEQ